MNADHFDIQLIGGIHEDDPSASSGKIREAAARVLARMHVILSEEIIAAIDAEACQRGRSWFLEEATREKLHRITLQTARPKEIPDSEGSAAGRMGPGGRPAYNGADLAGLAGQQMDGAAGHCVVWHQTDAQGALPRLGSRVRRRAGWRWRFGPRPPDASPRAGTSFSE